MNATASNVIDFNQARQRRTTLRMAQALAAYPDEKRNVLRKPSDARLFVQVVLSGSNPDLVGTTLSCAAVDLSTRGVHFRTSDHIPVGTLIDLWVDIDNQPGKFFLTGEVCWSEATDGDSFAIGCELKEGLATDYDEWEALHAS